MLCILSHYVSSTVGVYKGVEFVEEKSSNLKCFKVCSGNTLKSSMRNGEEMEIVSMKGRLTGQLGPRKIGMMGNIPLAHRFLRPKLEIQCET